MLHQPLRQPREQQGGHEWVKGWVLHVCQEWRLNSAGDGCIGGTAAAAVRGGGDGGGLAWWEWVASSLLLLAELAQLEEQQVGNRVMSD